MVHMAKTSFELDDSLNQWIEERLTYGQSKSSWFRYSVQMTHELDEVLDELYEKHQYEERRRFVRQAVAEKVEETKQDPSRGNDN